MKTLTFRFQLANFLCIKKPMTFPYEMVQFINLTSLFWGQYYLVARLSRRRGLANFIVMGGVEVPKISGRCHISTVGLPHFF